MAFKIRKASVCDTQAVYSLICDLENETLPFGWFSEIYLRNLENTSIFYFVCIQVNVVIAFASLHIQPLLHHCSNIAEIQEIVVKPEHQRHGIGHKLLMFWKRRHGIPVVPCWKYAATEKKPVAPPL